MYSFDFIRFKNKDIVLEDSPQYIANCNIHFDQSSGLVVPYNNIINYRYTEALKILNLENSKRKKDKGVIFIKFVHINNKQYILNYIYDSNTNKFYKGLQYSVCWYNWENHKSALANWFELKEYNSGIMEVNDE